MVLKENGPGTWGYTSGRHFLHKGRSAFYLFFFFFNISTVCSHLLWLTLILSLVFLPSVLQLLFFKTLLPPIFLE